MDIFALDIALIMRLLMGEKINRTRIGTIYTRFLVTNEDLGVRLMTALFSACIRTFERLHSEAIRCGEDYSAVEYLAISPFEDIYQMYCFTLIMT